MEILALQGSARLCQQGSWNPVSINRSGPFLVNGRIQNQIAVVFCPIGHNGNVVARYQCHCHTFFPQMPSHRLQRIDFSYMAKMIFFPKLSSCIRIQGVSGSLPIIIVSSAGGKLCQHIGIQKFSVHGINGIG